MTYLFDACALIAFINEETGRGYEEVDELIERAAAGEIVIYMSVVNLVEVHYDFIRSDGKEVADTIMRNVDALPITVIYTIDKNVSHTAARLKTDYSMSLADTFLCATAIDISATIVTKDDEIKAAEGAERLSVFWIK